MSLSITLSYMDVVDLHQRELSCTVEEAGNLIDTLSSEKDALWPWRIWPPMRLNRPLGEGAAGGHGPIGYYVEKFEPGQAVRFHFTRPRGFDGHHGYDLIKEADGCLILHYSLRMKTRGSAVITWPLVYRPLHCALIEDSMAKTQAALGMTPDVKPWSLYVRFLRWVLSSGKAQSQPASANRF